MISNITHRCAAKHRDELPSPHAFLKPKDYNLPHRMEAIVRHSKMACSTSALGQKQTFALQQPMSALHPIATAKANFRKGPCPLYLQKRTCAVHEPMSALGHKPTWSGLFDHLIG